MMNNEEPLIYTSKGNIPIAGLRYQTNWEDRPDAVIFTEEYFDGEECVKRSVHALSKHGVTGETVIGVLN